MSTATPSIRRPARVAEAQREAVLSTFDVFGKTADFDLSDETVTGMSYSVCQHLIEGATNAARLRDRESFAWFHDEGFDAAHLRFGIRTTVGHRLAMAPRFDGSDHYLTVDPEHLKRRHSLAEPPCPLLWRDTRVVDHVQTAALQVAFENAVAAGFTDLVTMGANIVSLNPDRISGLQNWTVVSLPGTVFLTDDSDSIMLGRELVHESGHNWLNDAFELLGCMPDLDAFFFSPWKNCMRPAFGFLHACWSFPLTVIYSVNILDRCDTELRHTLTEYVELQRRALRYVRDDFEIALKLVDDEEITDTLKSVFDAAAN